MTSSPTVGVGCLALTLSNRAPVPRTVRASISHGRSELRNQQDAEQSGRSRSPDLSFFFPTVFSLPRMYFRSSFLSVHAAFHIQPISVTWQRRASSCSLGNADLQGAQDWNFFWFSLIMPKISEMVTKMEAIFCVQVAQKHLPLSCLLPPERLSSPSERITAPIRHHSDQWIGADSNSHSCHSDIL